MIYSGSIVLLLVFWDSPFDIFVTSGYSMCVFWYFASRTLNISDQPSNVKLYMGRTLNHGTSYTAVVTKTVCNNFEEFIQGSKLSITTQGPPFSPDIYSRGYHSLVCEAMLHSSSRYMNISLHWPPIIHRYQLPPLS